MTNDSYELRTGDAIVPEILSKLRRESGFEGRQLLAKFAEMYHRTASATLLDVFIACFSATRDSPLHWNDYGSAA